MEPKLRGAGLGNFGVVRFALVRESSLYWVITWVAGWRCSRGRGAETELSRGLLRSVFGMLNTRHGPCLQTLFQPLVVDPSDAHGNA